MSKTAAPRPTPFSNEKSVQEEEMLKTDSMKFFHSKAAERYSNVRLDQCKVAWASNLSQVSEKNDHQVGLGVWPSLPPSVKISKQSGKGLNPLPGKKLNQTCEKPELPVKVVQWDKKPKASSRVIPVVMMPEVEKTPPMIHWTETPINVRVEDGEFLQNYPYLGDDADNKNFEDELYDLYNKKDFVSAYKPVMPDEVFFDTINDYEKSMLQSKKDCKLRSGAECEDLTRVKRFDVMMPSRVVFASMANTFSYLGFPYDLEQRYARIYKELNKPEDTADLPRFAGSDEAADPDKTINTFRKLFCPRCMIYCCITHDDDDVIDPKYQTAVMQNQETEVEIVCPNADCIEKPEETVKVTKKKKESRKRKSVTANWTQSEITLCKMLFETAKHKPCFISTMLTTKTCREVKVFLESELGVSFPIPSEEETTVSTEQGNLEKRNDDVGEKYVPRNDTVDSDDLSHYRPCIHVDNGACNTKNMCCCVDGSTYCERWCSCPLDCPRRFKGCNCTSSCGTSKCPCYRANRECDPTLCRKCGSEYPILIEGKCKNVAISHGREKLIELKKSAVAGWGGFIGCDVKKWELVAEYRGEVISQDEGARRGLYYDKIKHTYLFSLNEDLVVDATRIGSKVRFVNSSKHPNCLPKVMMVNGDHRIGIYAKRDISAGEELSFDYENVIKKSKAMGKGRKNSSGKTKTEVEEK